MEREVQAFATAKIAGLREARELVNVDYAKPDGLEVALGSFIQARDAIAAIDARIVEIERAAFPESHPHA